MSMFRSLLIVLLGLVAGATWMAAPSLSSPVPHPSTGFVMLSCLVVAFVVMVWPQEQSQPGASNYSDARRVRRDRAGARRG